ncbi:Predicted choloylglycine hydrolase [Roseovarius nanhaiticus]|uniref:Predicted choloylglycine hydrolase n=1 Tax=Roseovarius nanhaiticus TaxID=573024 RepID=A0A1N7HNA9_9RHOB|nr:C45 family peptidase [Roseovarius nanhaiticus]SIS26198.1 Predicted choloylglycine hydrolase [Roseovarius nanhaiticus]
MPDRDACRAAMLRHMPELVATYDQLVAVSGGSDRAARFLATWCPPTYLGGCSLAALADETGVRLVRNYDLSPELNEGLLLRSEWVRPVMGMVEFLWGLSDGINDAGLAVALAYGGRSETAKGFGITTILRYVLETCETVSEAIAVLKRVPSHMAYNIVLADRAGDSASVEVLPGGGANVMPHAVATNHQRAGRPDRPDFTRTFERHAHLLGLDAKSADLHKGFARAPLYQDRFAEGFGTLFTAEYDPEAGTMRLIWPYEQWHQSLERFEPGTREITFSANARLPGKPAALATGGPDWTRAALVDWCEVGRDYAAGNHKSVEYYLSKIPPRSPACGASW